MKCIKFATENSHQKCHVFKYFKVSNTANTDLKKVVNIIEMLHQVELLSDVLGRVKSLRF